MEYIVRSKAKKKSSKKSSKKRKAVKVVSLSDPSSNEAVKLRGKANKKFYLDKYRILHLLGRGGYGHVISVKDTKSKQLYAIKVMKKKERRWDVMVNEAKINRILKDFPCPFIVAVHRTFQTNGHLCMVMDLMDNGTLIYHIRLKAFSERKTCYYAACMVAAIHHLHKIDIVHRDIKPHNMVLDKNGYLKLSDFGLSTRRTTHQTPLTDKLGTGNFKAPEYFKEGPIYRMVDFWALGITIHLMLTGKYPAQTKVPFAKNKNFSPESRSIIRQMLKNKPEKRLGYGEDGAYDIMKHKFFRDINWEELENGNVSPPKIKHNPPPHKSPHKVIQSLKAQKSFIDINYDNGTYTED